MHDAPDLTDDQALAELLDLDSASGAELARELDVNRLGEVTTWDPGEPEPEPSATVVAASDTEGTVRSGIDLEHHFRDLLAQRRRAEATAPCPSARRTRSATPRRVTRRGTSRARRSTRSTTRRAASRSSGGGSDGSEPGGSGDPPPRLLDRRAPSGVADGRAHGWSRGLGRPTSAAVAGWRGRRRTPGLSRREVIA